MSRRQATNSSTTNNASTAKKKKMPPLPQIPSSPDPTKSQVQPSKAKRNRKRNQASRKVQEEKKWWEYAGPLIDTLGSKLMSAALPLITGFGDYEVDSNSILAAATDGKSGSTVPIMSNSKHANIIRHREYIGDVLSSTSEFSIKEYPLNPGNDLTFPWLYSTALSFSNYRMRGLVFEFVSTASNVSTTPALGYVAMATQYNSLDLPFSNKRAMDNSEYANSAAPTKSFAHPIECSPDQLALKELYVRHAQSPSGDLRLYDLGRFSIAVGGQTVADQIIGELWATYEVELYFPLLPNQGSNFLANYAQLDGLLGVGATTVLSPSLALSTKSTFKPVIQNVSSTVSTIHFPTECVGQAFRIEIRYISVSPAAFNPGFTWTGNGVNIEYVDVIPTGVLSTSFMYICSLEVKDNLNLTTITMSGGSWSFNTNASANNVVLFLQVPN